MRQFTIGEMLVTIFGGAAVLTVVIMLLAGTKTSSTEIPPLPNRATLAERSCVDIEALLASVERGTPSTDVTYEETMMALATVRPGGRCH